MGVSLSVLPVGPTVAVAGISVAAHARRAYAAAHVHVRVCQAAVRPLLEPVDLKAYWIGNSRRPHLSCSEVIPNNSKLSCKFIKGILI